ncbi:uncharacterized protein LOC143917848 isoform X2 [Arctopsyche grandis]|uniref:uncharacterized protein LOC143917848 isoform X2 n=1 Tax=Arctopsyche grandis TaxID=121162 RepID=UPI00406D9439
MSSCWDKEINADTIYLPAESQYSLGESVGVPIDEGIRDYINREFPASSDESSKIVCYSIPSRFIEHGEPQACQAEFETYKRFCNVKLPTDDASSASMWQACFQGISYAGRSYRGIREGQLTMREHDLVVFTIHQGKHFVSLIEVKSTCDDSTLNYKISDANTIKNNKRCGQHQLRDHVEMLKNMCEVPVDKVHCYLFWPFLSMWTTDPKGGKVKRWEKESDQHVFFCTISDQKKFDEWFFENIIKGKCIERNHFDALLKRFVVLSCGIFVNEIRDGMLALLSQEQLELLYNKPLKCGSPTIVHGAAGTGKTLLVLHRLRFLYDCGLLNINNRALYICYWPGIRVDFRMRLEKLKISEYVDTIRFAISNDRFLLHNQMKYRHIFMDECEAICLAFEEKIVSNTFGDIEKCRLRNYDENYKFVEEKYDKNHTQNSGVEYKIERDEIVKIVTKIEESLIFGDLWYLVDINQATMFIPKHSPNLLKVPTVRLTRVIRNTETIYKTFSSFYKNPLPTIPAAAKLSDFYLNNLEIGHNIKGPPILWVNADVIPGDPPSPSIFSSKNINKAISSHFVSNSVYHPNAVTYVEEFLTDCNPMEFLVPWVLRVKGLEFKVVIMVIENEDFDFCDPEDRRKIYIMASRCTCLLILVCSTRIKDMINVNNTIQPYQFDIDF